RPVRYDLDTALAGKAECKKALQKEFRLTVSPRTPLLGMVSRLIDKKGLDLLEESVPAMLRQEDVQLIVLGEGEPRYHEALLDWQKRFPSRVGVRLRQDEPLAHQITAGADI